MGSSRFPGKPLAKIKGIPMIGHVYHRAKMCQRLSEIYVATCDKEIADYINSISGEVIMTKDSHERATDRTNEAFIKVLNQKKLDISGVLMIQGDEPLINPQLIDGMVSFHEKSDSPHITNLVSEINSKEEFENSNVVKVVFNKNNKILYMSRSPIPSNSKYNKNFSKWKQLGLIIFSVDAINSYSILKETRLEVIESVDMNRVLENNQKIVAYKTSEFSQAVDHKEDIKIVERIFDNDKFFLKYK